MAEKLVVSVKDFGAVADIDAVQTTAFQAAIDHCFVNGGGEVQVPEGTYILGDIRIRSNVTLHLLENAVLKGSKNPKDYRNILTDKLEPLPESEATDAHWYGPFEWIKMGGGFKVHLYTAGSYWNYGLIRAAFAENIALIGEKGSLIDGNNVFDPEGEEDYRGPYAVNMHFCKNVVLKGYTVKDCSNWAHAIFQSEKIRFEDLTVLAGHDALHTRSCSDVEMLNCTLITGDDCVAGFDNINVLVKGCEISSACSAFRYGGYNILVEDCHIYGPCKYQFRGTFTREEKIAGVYTSSSPRARNNMLSLLTNFVTNDLPVRHAPGKIVFRNCTVQNADRFLHLNLSGNEAWQVGHPPKDITFENIKATGISLGVYCYGDGEVPVTLNFENVEYSVREGFENDAVFKVAHFDEINLKNVKITNFVGDTLIKTWSDGGKVNTENFECDLKENGLINKAEEEFKCNAI
ncbi:MAG: right-handed parallel beta-helix repeat-containing protein [Clostridia bacterium]|nr:right-handed parallel beta-helix repeat-containing protein [Clostridia bacterium]